MRKLLLALSITAILLGVLGLVYLWLDARFAATVAQTEAATARNEILLLREAGQAACVSLDQITRAAEIRGWGAEPFGENGLRVIISPQIRMKTLGVGLYEFDARGCLLP